MSRFRRKERMQEVHSKGIGLGMAIVKGLIEKMGGTIEVKSEEGIGSTFILRIPFKLAPAPDIVKENSGTDGYQRIKLIAGGG